MSTQHIQEISVWPFLISPNVSIVVWACAHSWLRDFYAELIYEWTYSLNNDRGSAKRALKISKNIGNSQPDKIAVQVNNDFK